MAPQPYNTSCKPPTANRDDPATEPIKQQRSEFITRDKVKEYYNRINKAYPGRLSQVGLKQGPFVVWI